MSSKWVVGMNMPGYMPDNEPSECDTFEEAKACMIGDLERSLDEANADTDEGAKEIAAIEKIMPRLKAVVMPEEIGFTIGRWHYFIAASAIEDQGSP